MGTVGLPTPRRPLDHSREVELMGVETLTGDFGSRVVVPEELCHVSLKATGVASQGNHSRQIEFPNWAWRLHPRYQATVVTQTGGHEPLHGPRAVQSDACARQIEFSNLLAVAHGFIIFHTHYKSSKEINRPLYLHGTCVQAIGES